MFYPKAIRPSDTPVSQAENTSSTVHPHVEVLLPSPPPPSQSNPARGDTALPEASSGRTVAVSEVGVASPGFQ